MRRLTDHTGWKLVSLLAAVTLWYLVVGDTEVAVSIPVVLEYRNIPPDVEITSDHIDRLFIKVRGPRPRVSVSALTGTSLALDLSRASKVGEQTVTITERELGLPAGVQLIRVVPAQIRLKLDRSATRSVPVKARITGAPPDGYRITRQTIVPDSVRITGPESNLQLISSVMTDPINLSSSVGYTEFRVPVAIDDPQLRVEFPEPVSVSITLEKAP